MPLLYCAVTDDHQVYSQLAGNTAIDGASARKYWYFMRLMGQSPSHIALETALQTHPNVVLLAEEVAAKRWSLQVSAVAFSCSFNGYWNDSYSYDQCYLTGASML
jgi:6-phosphofructokinase